MPRLTKEEKEEIRKLSENFNQEIIKGYNQKLKEIPIEVTKENFEKIRELQKEATKEAYKFNMKEDISTEIIGRNFVVEIGLRAKRKMGQLLFQDERFSIK